MNEKPSSAEKPDSRWSDDSAFVTESYETDSRLQYEPTVGMSNMGGRLAPPQREAAAEAGAVGGRTEDGVLAGTAARARGPWAVVLTYANALLCLLCFLLRRRLPTAARIIVLVVSGHLLLFTMLLSSVR